MCLRDAYHDEAGRFGKLLLKGHGYPNIMFSTAMDGHAIGLVLARVERLERQLAGQTKLLREAEHANLALYDLINRR
jgi:hypothetical protein